MGTGHCCRSLLVCVFWQRVAATRWELFREETPAIRAQEVASASASSGDTTATSVWCEGKNPTQFRCVASFCAHVIQCRPSVLVPRSRSTGVCPMTWTAVDHVTATGAELSTTSMPEGHVHFYSECISWTLSLWSKQNIFMKHTQTYITKQNA